MFALQILSALLLLLNKFYVYKKKTVGWVFGIWGTIVISIYFYLQMVLQDRGNLWIMIVYDGALLFLMIYGYLVSVTAKSKNVRLNEHLKKWNLRFKITISSLTITVCLFMLIQAITANLVVVQFLSAVGGLLGTLLLAFNTRVANIIGWMTYLVTHGIVTCLMMETGSPFIAFCQVVSAVIAILGIVNEFKKSKHEVILTTAKSI